MQDKQALKEQLAEQRQGHQTVLRELQQRLSSAGFNADVGPRRSPLNSWLDWPALQALMLGHQRAAALWSDRGCRVTGSLVSWAKPVAARFLRAQHGGVVSRHPGNIGAGPQAVLDLASWAERAGGAGRHVLHQRGVRGR